jgi:hypothetical protein
VTVFDTGSMAIGSPSASIGGQVGGIAIAPDGSRVYVGMFGSVNNGIIRAIVPSGFSGGTALSKTDAT